MTCPDEDEIVAYAQGHLGPAARERIGAHVDACPICVGLVAEAARAGTRIDGPGGAAEPAGFAEPPGRGSVLGRYLVLELLGAGGLGRVFSAYDPELDRRVAVKLLEPRAGGAADAADLRARLVREAQALAKVRHPNVVAVHDVGVVGEHVFVAMELVDGTTLREWLLAKERDWTEIRDVFVAAARGLAAVHDAGLVHRDVKPGNVLIGHDGRVQVADLGLARTQTREGAPEPDSAASASLRRSDVYVWPAPDDALTRSGTVMGTPAYMAPEQHRGERVDARADQFGFCVALFEALHGARPFAGTTSEQLAAAASAGAIVDVAARRVPGWLRRVALRGLAADPNDRFDSMHDVVAALQHDRRTRRRRLVAAAAGLVVAGACAWGFVIAPALAPGTEARDEVESLAIEARAAAAKAHFVHPPPDEPSQPTAYTKVLELEALDGAAEDLADARAAELRDEFATTLVGLGDRYWEIDGGTPFAAEYYAAALVFDDDHPRALARVGVSVAAMVALRERAATLTFGEPELVAAASAHALAGDDEHRTDRIEALYARTPEPPASVTAALERVLGEPGMHAVARGRARRGASPPTVVAEAPAPDDPREIVAAASAPKIAPAKARAADEPAPVSIAKAPSDPAGARAHAKAGAQALRRGDLSEAAEAFHRALEADRKDVEALAGLAEVHFQRRAYETSAKFFERAVALAPKNAELHLDLGDVYFKVLRFADARSHYEQARALGHGGADRRIARLDERLGAKP
jgi:tetratricopeptide (TPR) repeat protein